MIAPERAIIGGYRVRGVEVCPEESSEGLGEVELREGLGLVPSLSTSTPRRPERVLGSVVTRG